MSTDDGLAVLSAVERTHDDKTKTDRPPTRRRSRVGGGWVLD